MNYLRDINVFFYFFLVTTTCRSFTRQFSKSKSNLSLCTIPKVQRHDFCKEAYEKLSHPISDQNVKCVQVSNCVKLPILNETDNSNFQGFFCKSSDMIIYLYYDPQAREIKAAKEVWFSSEKPQLERIDEMEICRLS